MEGDGYTHHISRQFNQELEAVRTKTLEMGGLVERQVRDAIESVLTLDSQKADEVRNKDHDINQFQTVVDEECERILALRQPTASDLRLVLAISKIVSDIERIGDEASKVAAQVIGLRDEVSEKRGFVEIRHLGAHVGQMIHDALDAFARMDTDQAIRVAYEDNKVDSEYANAVKDMVKLISNESEGADRILKVIWALRSIERMGDHAKNIAEHVVYLVKGLDVRHIDAAEMADRVNKN
jgi:phosphate transport system protein